MSNYCVVAAVGLFSLLLLSSVNGQCSTPLPYAKLATGYCAYTWATNLGSPRGIVVATNGDVLYLDSSNAQVVALWEDASTHTVQKATIAKASGLNHGIAISKGYLYASSPTQVFRWAYTPGNRNNLGTGFSVVANIPCCHHTSRTIIFDADGNLFVQSGSGDNVDPDSSHSQIRRFNASLLGTGNLQWSTGTLYADGLRNEVGLRFDNDGRLWGVENGVDDLNRADLGGDIHQDNPSEEVNLFEKPGLFYGYPYCFSQGVLNNGQPKGTQWAHPNFVNDGTHTDAWCKNRNNVVAPAYNLPAHTAPLDILFYYGKTFPNIQGYAFVSSHGSWDRQPPAGYNVRLIQYVNGSPVNDTVFFGYQGPGETASTWTHRPVGLALNTCWGQECLLITDDGARQIIAVVRTSTTLKG